ncbi:MAG: tetratricopeptide repeat protein, partial [Candidatus Kapaibacterium sp.]
MMHAVPGHIWSLRTMMLCASLMLCMSVTAQVTTVDPLAEETTGVSARGSLFRHLYALSANEHEALLSASSTLPNVPTSEWDRYRTVLAYLESGRSDLAEYHARRFLGDPSRSGRLDAFIHSLTGIARVRERDFTGAALMFRRVRSDSFMTGRATDDSAMADLGRFSSFWLANSLVLSGASDEALTVYAEIAMDTLAVYADDALLAAGQIHEMQGREDDAYAAYMRIIDRYPSGNSILSAQIRAAQCLLRRREASNALTRLAAADEIVNTRRSHPIPGVDRETARDLVDQQSKIRYLRGEALHSLGLYEGALQEFVDVTRQDVDGAMKERAFYGMGASLMALSRWPEAIAAFDSVLRLRPDLSNSVSSLAVLFKGIALKQSGDRMAATDIFRRCAESTQCVVPDRALQELGQMFYEDGRLDSAKSVLRRAEQEARDARSGIRSNVVLGSVHMDLQEWGA